MEHRQHAEHALLAAAAASGMQSSICQALAVRLACVSIAPFGVPVVPPVYCSTATSSRGEIATGVGRVRARGQLGVAQAEIASPDDRRDLAALQHG